MYLYVDCAKKLIADLVSKRPNLDPRVAEYINGSFVAHLRNHTHYHVPVGIAGKTGHYDTVKFVAWSDAPESLKQAVMNGEEMAALNEGLVHADTKTAITKVSRFVKKGKGRDTTSLQGYDYAAIVSAYDQATIRIREKRRAREARSQMVRIWTEGDVEMFPILGSAALGVVGSALRNCVRDAYTNDRRSIGGNRFGEGASRVYMAFRSITTGKWTSLGDAYVPDQWSNKGAQLAGHKFQHSCHEWLENDAQYFVQADKDLWYRFLDGEFTVNIHYQWHSFHRHKNERRIFLNKTVFPHRSNFDVIRGGVPVGSLYDTYLQAGRRTGRDGLTWIALEHNFGFQTYQRYVTRNFASLRAYERDSETAVTTAASPAFNRTRNQLALRGEQQRRASAGRCIPGIVRGLVSRV